jgi:chromosome segregation ATPase
VKRVLSGIGMTLAVIGIVISLAMIVGIWSGRGAVSSELASISAGIDGRLQRVDAALDHLTNRLETAQGRVNEASANAMQLGQGSTADGPIVDALGEKADQLADDYADMRESFVIAREGIIDARERLDWLRQQFPMLPIPQLSGDQLQALEQRLGDLNASLAQLRIELSTRQGPVAQIRDRVIAALNNVSTGIGEVASQVSAAEARVDGARTSLAETQAAVERWATAGAVVASLLCLYGVLLNLSLFVVARAWFRPPAATPVAT